MLIRMHTLLVLSAAALSGLAACQSGPTGVYEATSLLGRPLYAPELDTRTREKYDRNLADAEARFEADPHNEDNIVWVGRRLAYLGRYREAIVVYTDGLDIFPDSYKLLRHRGHRQITIRRLDDAIADLGRAADLIQGVSDEVEPDGLPNARKTPTSTSHTNIYYHLGLAHYLKGEFAAAFSAYRRCMDYAGNDDMRCATAYWEFLTLRRLGRDAEAAAVLEPITEDMDVIENFTYHNLLLLFKGQRSVQQIRRASDPESPVGPLVDDATLGYGIGAWHRLNGRTADADRTFHEVVSGKAWAAFGHIAAEAEIARTAR